MTQIIVITPRRPRLPAFIAWKRVTASQEIGAYALEYIEEFFLRLSQPDALVHGLVVRRAMDSAVNSGIVRIRGDHTRVPAGGVGVGLLGDRVEVEPNQSWV
jgi:hypothetical protein